MEVANLEIYLAIGRLFSQNSGIELKLHDDTDWKEDVVIFHDYFSPWPKRIDGINATVK
jgi:hypothetical protein